MIRLTDALRDLVRQSPILPFGMGHKLLNLSQTALFLKPLVESRAKKEVKPAALLMALSRLQRNLGKAPHRLERFRLEKITVHSSLCSISYSRAPDLQTKINHFLRLIERHKGYMNVTEGMQEVTVLFDQNRLEDAKRILGSRPRNENLNIASLSLKYHERYNRIPGILSQILEMLAFQGINLLEIASTHTEFIFFVPQEQVNLAFDTLYNAFGPNAK